MAKTGKKRKLERDGIDQTHRVQRLRISSQNCAVSSAACSPISCPLHGTEHDVDGMVSMSCSADEPHASKHGIGQDSVEVLNTKVVDSAHRSSVHAFTYQPFEEYQKVEALRRIFLKHGLDYKQPPDNMVLLNEANLFEYMVQWESCLAHWYSIMGPDPPAKTPPSSNKLSCSTLAGIQFGLSNKPAFKSTIEQWAASSSAQERVRQFVQSEVRRQLDDLSSRPAKFGDLDLDGKARTPRPRLESIPSSPPNDTRLSDGRQSHRVVRSKPADFQQHLDELTKMPEMIPVRQLSDGTIEYIGDGEGTNQHAHD